MFIILMILFNYILKSELNYVIHYILKILNLVFINNKKI